MAGVKLMTEQLAVIATFSWINRKGGSGVCCYATCCLFSLHITWTDQGDIGCGSFPQSWHTACQLQSYSASRGARAQDTGRKREFWRRGWAEASRPPEVEAPHVCGAVPFLAGCGEAGPAGSHPKRRAVCVRTGVVVGSFSRTSPTQLMAHLDPSAATCATRP